MQHPQQHHQQPQPVPTSWEPGRNYFALILSTSQLLRENVVFGSYGGGGGNVFTFICIVDSLFMSRCLEAVCKYQG